jgi:predicted nuclease of predicted toxin-antitoxin system
VKFLVDACLSPVVAARLAGAGHDAVHVADLSMTGAADEELLPLAAAEERVIVTADTDFGTLLAVRHLSRPSLILLRSADELTPEQQADLVIDNLRTIESDLAAGAAVSLTRRSARVRRLPVSSSEGS